jgi:hypothetical protein
MISSRGHRIAEQPRISSGRARSLGSSRHFQRTGAVPLLRARAPPGCGEIAQHRDEARPQSQQSRPQTWHWASGGAASPGNQAPPQTDYGTQPNTERSYGMSTHTTSACAQCKGSFGRSSWAIVAAGREKPLATWSQP